MQQAQANGDVLGSQDNVKLLANVLKTNVAACTSIGTFFVPQISRIFLDMLQLYQAVSGMISMAVANEGIIEHYGIWSILMEGTPRCGGPQDPQNPRLANNQERNS